MIKKILTIPSRCLDSFAQKLERYAGNIESKINRENGLYVDGDGFLAIGRGIALGCRYITQAVSHPLETYREYKLLNRLVTTK